MKLSELISYLEALDQPNAGVFIVAADMGLGGDMSAPLDHIEVDPNGGLILLGSTTMMTGHPAASVSGGVA